MTRKSKDKSPDAAFRYGGLNSEACNSLGSLVR